VRLDRDLADVVQPDPLDQRADLALDGDAVDDQLAGRFRDDDGLVLEQPQEGAELRLLNLLRVGVAKQLHTARQSLGDELRIRHGSGVGI